MAIARMSHIRLVGLKRDQNKILDVLTARGLFEARATDSLPFAMKSGETGLYRELKTKQAEVSFALGFLKGRHAAMASRLAENKKAIKRGTEQPIEYTLSDEKYSDTRTLITRADFSDAAAREYELSAVCAALREISFDIADCNSKIGAIDGAIAAYKPFAAAPIKLSELTRSGDINISLYHNRTASAPDGLLDELPCAYEVCYGDGIVIVAVTRAKNTEDVAKRICASGYTRCTFDDDCTAGEKIRALENEKSDIRRRIFELTKTALTYEKHVQDLRILYDVIQLDIERAEAESGFLKSDSVFVLEGWMPERVAEDTVSEVKDMCKNVFIQLLAPEEKDNPPTLCINNKAVEPYEQITNMYSPPHYGEIDPNPVMSMFYFLFFGIMIGDAAYGVILAVLGFIAGKSKKLDTGIKRMALLIGMGGISSIVWGILFGGYFSIDFGGVKTALWFNPLEEPLTMLILSIVLGVVHLSVGYIVKFVSLCKDGKPFSAIFDAGSIIILFVAVSCLGISMMLDNPPAGLNTAAVALACISVALILVFGGRKNKNIFGKVLGGVTGLYGLVNLLSDVLSYCRLFGLCLASCAIGLAFNTLGGMFFGIPIIGYVIGCALLIPLHTFNIAIGVLSAYVHDARLQFLEFYSKFYTGDGRLFSPLGANTKYIRYS